MPLGRQLSGQHNIVWDYYNYWISVKEPLCHLNGYALLHPREWWYILWGNLCYKLKYFKFSHFKEESGYCSWLTFVVVITVSCCKMNFHWNQNILEGHLAFSNNFNTGQFKLFCADFVFSILFCNAGIYFSNV